MEICWRFIFEIGLLGPLCACTVTLVDAVGHDWASFKTRMGQLYTTDQASYQFD